MAQEIDRISGSLALAKTNEAELQSIPLEPSTGSILKGNIVRTQDKLLLLACSLGKVETESGPVLCISTGSPLGKLLLGKQLNERIEINGFTHEIREIG